MTERVRHIKRGTTYKVIGEGKLQWSAEAAHHPWLETTPMVVYQSEQDGQIWIRPRHEFNDPARFEKLEPTSVEPQKVYIVTGEHPWISGTPRKVFGSIESARKEAAGLVNLIRVDFSTSHYDDRLEAVQEATPENWSVVLEKLIDIYDAIYSDFYVDLRIEEVLP